MKKIGITGGIGSGKTTVAKYIESLNYIVIDADKIAYDLSLYDNLIINELIIKFGNSIINDDRSLDRKMLGNIVFNDPIKRKILDDIFQPRIKSEIIKKFKEIEEIDSKSIVFLDAPLIFEVGLNNILDKVWLVDADINIKISRINQRDSLSSEEIKLRIDSQMNTETKIAMADEILINNGTIQELKDKINKLLEKEIK